MKSYKCAALVIGNNNYNDNPKLKNAIADAELMAEKFKELRYDVYKLVDCTSDEFDSTFDDIIYKKDSERKPVYDVVVLYFAGHGLMSMQSDYIVMIDAQDMLKYGGVSATHKSKEITKLYQSIRNEQIPIAIFIIDACRKDYGVTVTTERGLATSFSEVGKNILLQYQTFLAFSTSPKVGASDGIGGHSAYTKALANHIMTQIPIEFVFKNVRRELYSGPGSQLPWEHSCLVEEFCFNHGQLTPHYGSLYSQSAFTDKYETNSDNFIKASQIIQSSIDASPISLISQIRGIFDELTPSDQFVLGRLFLGIHGERKEDFSSILSKPSLKTISPDGTCHFLNGMLYEIYFYENDEFRGNNIAGASMLSPISRLCKDKEFSNSVEFIKNELGIKSRDVWFLPGRKENIKVYIELSKDRQQSDNNKDLYTIDDINIQDDSILDRIDIRPYTRQSIREKISEILKIPSEDIDFKFSRYGNADDIYAFRSLDAVDIEDMLNEYFLTNTLSDLDSISHHYEYGSIDELTILDMEIDEEYLNVYCSFSIHVVIYLDGEEEVKYSETLWGGATMCMHQTKNGWLPEVIEDLNIEVSSVFE